jgi:Tol biopolymer transport system component
MRIMIGTLSQGISYCLFAICVLFSGVCAAQEQELPLEGATEQLEFSVQSGSWMSVDVLPDGDALVFDLLGDIYRLPRDGGKATAITSGLGFDSQPAVSPDGGMLAFISDRSGADNLWVSNIDGSDARMLSSEEQFGLISPAWTPDGQYVVVTRTAVENELVLFHVAGGSGVTLSGRDEESVPWGVGAVLSPDGRYIYLAASADSNWPVDNFPTAQISRFHRLTGHMDQITRAEGGGFRPALSPDGSLLVYGSRDDTQTGLRLRNLETGDDRWLVYPVQRDGQENWRPPSRDVLPGYSFTPDGSAVIYAADGRFHEVAVATGERREIAFAADVSLHIGPDLTAPYRVPRGPLTATLIHDPGPSPDGRRVVASVLGRLYVMDRDGGEPEPITAAEQPAFKPVWSPDGRWIAYVTWQADEGGHIWRTRSDGRGRPQRLSDHPAFYTDLAYTPDGDSLLAMRGNGYMRNQTFSEFTGLDIPLELLQFPADGGAPRVILPARSARHPHFADDPSRIFLYDESGLFSVALDGSDRREELAVTGPSGNRRLEDPPAAERVLVSPRGDMALALVNGQVWVMPFARSGGAAPAVSVRDPAFPAIRLTDIGADFLGWEGDGSRIYWAVGNSFFWRDLDSIDFTAVAGADAAESDEEAGDVLAPPRDEHGAVSRIVFAVTAARNMPRGRILLRGGNVIPMSGSGTASMAEVLQNQDLLIVDNRIAAIGSSGSIEVADDVRVIDVTGRYILPGFIDTHAHWELRTGDVLEPHNWSLAANLAYGVTSGLDVQTSHKDYFAYRDFQQTGQSIGQRAFMVGPGIFGSNDFQSYSDTHAFLRRYREFYNTRNIKSYLVGNRRQRQWVVKAALELGLMPTTEGGGDQKLDITHAIDGMHGNEHNLPDFPVFEDVVELYAQTKTAYTPTLIVQYNAEEMREFFFTRSDVHGDAKLRRFYPVNRLDELTERRSGWVRDEEFSIAEGAALAASIQRAGGLVGVGGHGELQGLGYHWEMWAYAMGGMTPVEILRAATIDGARIIGIEEDLGSLEPGKLADLVVLDANPLQDIRNTTAIEYVMQDGRLFDGDTLDEIWPTRRPLPPFWWWDRSDIRYYPR